MISLTVVRILENIERIMKDDDHSAMNLGRISDQLDEIFTTLCGDFPGAVAVRFSYADFQNLPKPTPSIIPDQQPQVYSEEATHPSRPTSKIKRGETGSEDVDSTELLETQGPNRNTAVVHSPWPEPAGVEIVQDQNPQAAPIAAPDTFLVRTETIHFNEDTVNPIRKVAGYDLAIGVIDIFQLVEDTGFVLPNPVEKVLERLTRILEALKVGSFHNDGDPANFMPCSKWWRIKSRGKNYF
jgi:hypothetical protein